ncbi:MAG: hypothetical protein K6G26_10940 [Lachnospiraceae bacterium]|nr:hypothetical protein [Lachnospiraceae bacterium]
MKQTALDSVASMGAFVENPKNVLTGLYNGYHTTIVKAKNNIYEISIYADRGNCSMNDFMGFLYGEIGVMHNVKSCFYENSIIRVTLKSRRDYENNIKNILDNITDKLKKMHMTSGCGICGGHGACKAYYLKKKVIILCEGCYERYYESVCNRKLSKWKRNRYVVNSSDDFNKGIPFKDNTIKKEDNVIPIHGNVVPKPEPIPVIKSEPAPAPKPAPVIKPEPVPVPKPAPVIKPAPEPKPSPVPNPVLTPTPVPSMLTPRTKTKAGHTRYIIKNGQLVPMDQEKVSRLIPAETETTSGTLALVTENDTVTTFPTVLLGNNEGTPNGKSVLTGIVGTVAGAVGAIFLWILAYELQFRIFKFNTITEFAAIATSLLMLLGYAKFTDKITLKGIIAVNISIIVVLFLAYNITIALNISDYTKLTGENMGFIDGIKEIPALIKNSLPNRRVYIKSLVGSYILALVADVFTIYILKNRTEYYR